MIVPKEVVDELRDFQSWANANKGLDLYDYATLAMTPDQFVALLEVIEPELIIHDGQYFRKRAFDEATYSDWIEKLHDPREVQKVMNHIHVSQFAREANVPFVLLKFIGDNIARLWTRAFADKGLVAEAYSDGDDVEVTLFRT